MSETVQGERSVAAIMGWEFTPYIPVEEGGLGLAGEWRRGEDRDPHGLSNRPPQPTIDDMLAWLHDRGWATAIESTEIAGGLWLLLELSRHGQVEHYDKATTLQAALEAAVRKVTE